MDFIDDINDYGEAMRNAYMIVTKKITLDDVFADLERKWAMEEDVKFFLPFDPINQDGRDPATLDLLIEYFIDTEEYEKCAELQIIKEKVIKCLEEQTD